MRIPSDWDRPSPKNGELCDKFTMEEYDAGSFRLPYRLFVPDGYSEEKGKKTVYPGEKRPALVVYLHGADAVGTDNRAQLEMHDIGTMYAKDEWQKEHPCFIIAPQYHTGTYWTREEVISAIISIIGNLIVDYSFIDLNRIYAYGYSAGGAGVFKLLKTNPDLFAGALVICGATGREDLKSLVSLPMWLIHAADDDIVKASYSEGDFFSVVHLGSRDVYRALKDENKDLKYTEYPRGYMKEHYGINPHCTWVTVSDKREEDFSGWLFSQSRSLL